MLRTSSSVLFDGSLIDEANNLQGILRVEGIRLRGAPHAEIEHVVQKRGLESDVSDVHRKALQSETTSLAQRVLALSRNVAKVVTPLTVTANCHE